MMSYRSNSRQLVIRRDSATGLMLVGWASDLPIGRFEHIQLIGESAGHTLPEPDGVLFEEYQFALELARQANAQSLAAQVQLHQSQGWLQVPFALVNDSQAMHADSVGVFTAAAMQLHFRLAQNCKQAWAVLTDDKIVHIRARFPQQQLDELTFQVWYHQQLAQLNAMGDNILEGTLIVSGSGLWLAPSH